MTGSKKLTKPFASDAMSTFCCCFKEQGRQADKYKGDLKAKQNQAVYTWRKKKKEEAQRRTMNSTSSLMLCSLINSGEDGRTELRGLTT